MAMHRWEGYDHPTLFKMINSGPGPAASTAQTEYWAGLTSELEQIDADLATKLSTMQATWEGGAADQAQAGLTPLQAWAADAQSGASMMRASTEYQADAVGRARSEMPEPVAVTTPAPSGWDKLAAGAAVLVGNPGPAAAVIAQSQDHEAQEAKQDAASQKAVDTMDSYQSSTNFNTSTLGTFVPPPDVVVSTPAPDGGVGHQIGYAISNASGASGTSGGTAAASYTPVQLGSGTPGHYVAPTGGGTPVHTTPSVPGSGVGPSYTPISASTTPAGYTPPAGSTRLPNGGFTGVPGTPGSGGGLPGGALPGSDSARFTGGFRPGVSPAEGGAGLAKGGPAAGLAAAEEAAARRGGIAGGPGGSVPAEGSSRGGANPLARGGVAGAGSFSGESVLGGRNGTAAGAAGGRAGVGGGAMGGRGGANAEEEEDFEHASYLVETEDIFGDDRHVAPGVLGSDQ